MLRSMAGAVSGARREEFASFHGRVGLTRESWYLQQSPMGELCTVYLEGDDPAESIRHLGQSAQPFDVWFKDECKQVHGIDFNLPPPGPLPESVAEGTIPGPAPRASIAVVAPLLSGKTETWRSFTQEVLGPRRGELDDFHQRVGLSTENWYLQRTPQGDLVIVYLEGDIPNCFQVFATSDHPFDRWLQEVWLDTEGIDFRQPFPGPLPEVVYESLPSAAQPVGVGGI